MNAQELEVTLKPDDPRVNQWLEASLAFEPIWYMAARYYVHGMQIDTNPPYAVTATLRPMYLIGEVLPPPTGWHTP